MNCLLDTSTLLWSLFSPKDLSNKIRAILLDKRNSVYVSTVSFWEISLKYSLGKLELPNVEPQELVNVSKQSGFQILSLEPEIVASFHQLPRAHKDPFDRMLVWQAIQSNHTLISKDKEMGKYEKYGLSLLW